MEHDASFGLLTGNNIDAHQIKAGSVIFRQGEAADQLFVIKSGEGRILIGNEPRSATAVAMTDVELVPVSEKQFLFLVSQTPYFALKVMRVLARRLRATTKTFG